MMSLVLAASALRRKVYASLPRGYRLFLCYLKLADQDTSILGLTLYAYFLMNGVTGLPPIGGKPAQNFIGEDLDETIKNIKILAPGYGKDLGRNLYGWAIKNFKDLADEVISETYAKVLKSEAMRDWIQGKNLDQAQGYIFTTVENMAKDMWKARKVRKHDETESLTNEEGIDRALEDPSSFKDFEERINIKEVYQGVAKELARSIDPELAKDVPLYLKLHFEEGYEVSDIFRDKMLPYLETHPTMKYPNWKARYEPKILHVLRKHMERQRRAA